MDKYFFGGVGAVILISILLMLSVADTGNFSTNGKAAVIPLEGSITSSSSSVSSSSITPSKVRNLNTEARDNAASAIIYEWNSGGGAVVASKEIKREIESVEIPTVCRFRDVSASGAYLASLGCDRIVADSASITGSIGVRSSYMEFSELMQDLGINYVNITSGKYKDAGSPYQNITDEEKALLQEKTDTIHDQFIEMVVTERNLTDNQREEVRTGEIFLGTEARELKLVDTLGGRQKAVEEAEKLTGTDLETSRIETRPEFSLLSLMNANSGLENLIGNSNVIEADLR